MKKNWWGIKENVYCCGHRAYINTKFKINLGTYEVMTLSKLSIILDHIEPQEVKYIFLSYLHFFFMEQNFNYLNDEKTKTISNIFNLILNRFQY